MDTGEKFSITTFKEYKWYGFKKSGHEYSRVIK